MTNTIADLWHGNIEPIRHFGMHNPEMKQLEHLIQQNLEKIEACLSEQEKELLKKYVDCINEYILINSEQAFCDGFCIGTKLITEALSAAEQFL